MVLDPPKYVERNARFNAIGRRLYGDRWQSPLAAALRRPITTINSVATGRRAVTRELEVELGLLIQQELVRREREAVDLQHVALTLMTGDAKFD